MQNSVAYNQRKNNAIIDNHLTDSQFGFRKSKGTRDAIFVLRMMGERMIQHQRELYITFIDYTKAFDRVNHEKLIKLLKDIGIPFTKPDLLQICTGIKVQKYDTEMN